MQQMKVSAVPCGQNWRNKHVKSNVESGVVMAFWLSTMLEVLLLAGCIFFVAVWQSVHHPKMDPETWQEHVFVPAAFTRLSAAHLGWDGTR